MMDILKAKVIAQQHVGHQFKLHSCTGEEIPNSLYNFDAGQLHVFRVEPLQEYRIGGDRYVVVDKTDGNVRDLGYHGE